jgi:hypothetical protein
MLEAGQAGQAGQAGPHSSASENDVPGVRAQLQASGTPLFYRRDICTRVWPKVQNLIFPFPPQIEATSRLSSPIFFQLP